MNNIFLLIEALERCLNTLNSINEALEHCLNTLDSIKERTVLSNEDVVEINRVINYCSETHKYWQGWTDGVFEGLTDE